MDSGAWTAWNVSAQDARLAAERRGASPISSITSLWLRRMIAVVLAFLGNAALVGWYALFVLPLSLATTAIVRRNHNEVMDEIGLTPRRSFVSSVSCALTFHAVQAPLSIWSYLLELSDDHHRD